MNAIVVLELDVPTNVRILGPGQEPAHPQGPVRRAHVAAPDPAATGACGPVTLCGLPTRDMTIGPHQPSDPDRPQPTPRWHTCSLCRVARRDSPSSEAGPADDAEQP
jgi:hypothetical protein